MSARRAVARPAILALTLALACVAVLAVAADARAGFAVDGFDGGVFDRDGGGVAVEATQAGSRPDEASATIDFSRVDDPDLTPLLGYPVPDGMIRDVRVDLPPGLVGNPLAVPRCTEEQITTEVPGSPVTSCPVGSQVGIIELENTLGPTGAYPVFNMVPPPGVPAAFAFNYAGVVTHFLPSVRSEGDYGLTVNVKNANQALAVYQSKLTFWGVPADSSHDALRGRCAFSPTGTDPSTGQPCRSTETRRAFLTNPTSCVGPVETRLWARSWDGVEDTASFMSHRAAPNEDQLVGVEGCDLVPFAPSFAAEPASGRAGAPAGYSFDLSVPQDDNPDGLAQAHLKKAVVVLPEGVSIAPGAADGLAACSEGQDRLGTRELPNCPLASKVASVKVDTPVLDKPMSGAVYIRQPRPGNLFRLLLVAEGPGVVVKLPGDVTPDPVTGQLTATFDNNPQLPFSNLHLEFKDGPRAPLTNPSVCGTHTTRAELTSWSGKTVVSESSFEISRDGNGAPCAPRGFTPDFMAGVGNPVAGSFSTFALSMGRDDEDQILRDVAVDMPEGLLGRIAGVEQCPDAAAAAGSCGEGSRIGSTMSGAGAGTNPFFLPGRVYLTGPYKGAPYGLSVVVPAIAGPFDLGTVVVRAAVHVDRNTARLRVISDPLPTILEGVPLQIRRVDVKIDRPGFVLSPTSCAAKQVAATISSVDGSQADRSTRFQVGDCASLRFTPKLALRLTGSKQVTTGKHPGVRAQVRQSGIGEAGIRQAVVKLPGSLALDPDNAQALCEFVDGTKPDLENRCPKGSIVGDATAVTPLLAKPLSGKVFFVKNVRRDPKTGNPIRTLPMIVVALRGEIAINLKGESSTAKDGRLVNTFASVPDAPITRFDLNIAGGANGILAVTRTRAGKINVCRSRQTAQARFAGQNTKRADFNTPVRTPCAKKSKHAKRAKRR